MKGAIRVELTPDGNPSFTQDIVTIARPITDLSPEQIGRTLEAGQPPERETRLCTAATYYSSPGSNRLRDETPFNGSRMANARIPGPTGCCYDA
jgi:hypothetical protein